MSDIISIIMTVSSVCAVVLIFIGINGVYRFAYPRAVLYSIISFFGAVTFIVSVVMIFIPDFFVK